MVEYYIKKFSEAQKDITKFIVRHRDTNSEDLVKWRYRKLTDIDDINALAVDKNHIVGLKSYFIRKMIMRGAEYYLADFGHIQVEEDYEGKGIFTKLQSNATLQVQRHTVHCLFGIPTRRIMKMLLKQKWENIGNILFFTKRLNIYSKLYSIFPSKSVCKFVNKVFVGLSTLLSSYPFIKTRNYAFSEIAEFSHEYEILCRKINRSIPIMRLRDKAFLTWRFIEKPLIRSKYKIYELTREGQLRGYVVLLLSPDSEIITIVDFLADYKDMPVLLKMTIGHLRSFNEDVISKVMIGISENHQLIKILKLFGFKKSRNKLPVIIKISGNLNIPHSLILKIKNWHITYADKDTI